MLYRALRAHFRMALKVYYRSIEVEGLAHVPDTAPVLFAPNHPNALLDPMFIALAVERPVWLTAKSTLMRNPLLAALMRAGNVIALHRAQDAGEGADPRANLAALDAIAARLRQGGAVIVFPEGQSHGDPGLRPFKRGVARLAYDYVAAGDVGGLVIVPVGIWLEDKDGFRSRAWVRFGAPIAVGPWRAARPEAKPQVLTSELEAAVAAAAVTFADRREALLLGWAAEIAETGGRAPARLGRDGPGLAQRARLVARLRRGYRLLATGAPGELAPLVERVAAHRRTLRRAGITPAEVYLPLDAPRAAWFVLREAAIALAGAPPALWGLVTHALPVALIALAARRLARTPDQVPTFAVFGALVLLPPWYVALAVALWRLLPAPWGLVALALAPLGALAAVLWAGRLAAALRRGATFLHFLRRPGRQAALAEEGRAILAALAAYEARLGPPVEADAGDTA